MNIVKDASFNGNVVIYKTTPSTSSTSGALQVVGGVGIGGNINIGGNATIGGNINVNGFMNIVKDASFNGNVVIYKTTPSTSSTSGALQVVGGVGIGGNVNIDGNITIGGNVSVNGFMNIVNDASFNGNVVIYKTTPSTSSTTGAFQVRGGLGIGGNLFVQSNTTIFGDTSFNGIVSIINTTNSTGTNSTSGALQVAGGVGIGGNVNIGGNININNGIILANNKDLTLGGGGSTGKINFLGTPSLSTNYISAGTGDGATATTYNLKISSWYGIVFHCQYTDAVKIFFNVRTGTINADGQITGGSFNASSDYRIKENVEVLSKTIDQLNPVEYDLSGGKHDMGFIAHEVQEIFPFLVNGEKDGKELQSINYNGFIALLVKEVQELKKKNKLLHEKNKEFENRLKVLENRFPI